MTSFLESLSSNIVVDKERCIACGVCVERCILDNLRLLLPACRQACPLDVNCQGYMQLIARGDDEAALEVVRKTLPFPGVLGRICSQPCEAACRRGAAGQGDPLAIRALKRYLAEKAAEAKNRSQNAGGDLRSPVSAGSGDPRRARSPVSAGSGDPRRARSAVPAGSGDPRPACEAVPAGAPDPRRACDRNVGRTLLSVGGSGTGSKTKPLLPDFAADTGKRVAIIGSGPAGMLAAHDLRVRGHAVVIHEAEPEPGGMLRWAIPEFRLPLRVLRDELRWLEEMGVQLRCGVRVGVDLALTALRNQYDAVIVAVGCSKSNRLEIEGEELAGVMAGLPLLRAARGQQAPDVGKRVVVVGGGNVAVDAAQTALRLGAESVTIVCLEARGELPAFPWAVESALAEKIEFQYGWGPVRFLGDGGVVSGVELQRCERVFDDQGRFNPQWRPDERRTAAADTAVVAVGQARDTSLFAGTGLLRDGGVRADPLTLQTDDEKTFLAGDFATGPSTAVEAMAQGRQAAESVDRFLRGEPIRYGRQYAGPYVRDFEIPIRPDPPRDRARTPTHVCGGAGDFAEIELSLGSEAARREAARCNHCGSPIGFHNTCWFCLPCEVECPYEAIRIEVPYWLR